MTRTPTARRAFALLTALVLLLAMAAPSVAVGPNSKKPVDVQILGLNDFHGQLEPVVATSSSGGRIGAVQGSGSSATCNPPTCIPAGGVEYLATHVRALRATNPDNTAFVSAGDLIGATPLLSALFHDEPSIEAFNLMELDYNGVGNHEFDEGVDELLRVAYGSNTVDGYAPARPDGCHPSEDADCADGTPYHGADFPFLAANVAYKETGETIFAPYAVHEFDRGAKVAFIGMTLEGTPLIVSPGGISMVDFLDEAETVNALVPELLEQGVEAIVVLLHEGGSVPVSGNGAGDVSAINSCTNPTGAIPQIVPAFHDEVDIVITGHTNWAVNCVIDGKVVTGAASQGRLITDIDAKVSPATGDFIGPIRVNNRIVTRDVAPAPDMTALIAEKNVFAGPIGAVPVGSIGGDVIMNRRETTAAGESTLGQLIADAQLASTASTAGGQLALMNPGGIRADLDPGTVTHAEAFAVQPFSNIVTTKTLTGAQLKVVLEQQFSVNSLASPGAVGSTARTAPTILQVSAGFSYTWSASAPLGSKVSNMVLNGTAIDPAATYRVTMNNFIGAGGDDFPALTLGTNEQTGLDDLVALEAYLATHNPYTPADLSVPANQRITTVP
ncbi:MAG TPA: bifunctional metallophosphatase/5'-nucleotidase [Candidatus Limnocylindria bacterium]|nr:bifunctional metallophosphatase/5'-nucleotidase [Candidatus Limnocylindria bacterium]